MNGGGRAHFLALASASTALVGGHWEDIKWGISVLVSIFGTCAALWMFQASRKDGRRETEKSPRPPKAGFWNERY